jgi:hypothetical protein
MIKLSSLALATTVAALLLAGPAAAQSTAPAAAPAAKTAPAPTAAPKAKTATKTERSAVSLECSKQADAKGLHGKERHKFRSTCKKSGGKAM